MLVLRIQDGLIVVSRDYVDHLAFRASHRIGGRLAAAIAADATAPNHSAAEGTAGG